MAVHFQFVFLIIIIDHNESWFSIHARILLHICFPKNSTTRYSTFIIPILCHNKQSITLDGEKLMRTIRSNVNLVTT